MFGPKGWDDRNAAEFKIPKIGLADVPADNRRRVEDWDAEDGDPVECCKEILGPVLIVPGAMDQHRAEARPVGVWRCPTHRLYRQPLRRETLPQDIELKIVELRVSAAIWRIRGDILGDQQGYGDHPDSGLANLACNRWGPGL